MTFVKDDGEFDVDAFRAACRVMITAQEILVDNSSYPTKAIEKNSHAYRPLGLGYANLGALLMSRGFPTTATPAAITPRHHRGDDRRGLRAVGPSPATMAARLPATRSTASRSCA